MTSENAQKAIERLLAHAPLQKLFRALSGEEIRVVGGAVRNALIGAEIADIDIAAAALPQVIAEKAGKAGLRVVPTGVEHGTLTLVFDGTHFEVTSLREDVETDGRRAKVRFGRDFAADALRRDFTVNALSIDADGRLYDYTGGLEDLAARRIRFIGAPEKRIAEDFLRILRFFRFSASFGEGPLDAAGLEACIALRAGLAHLSRERLGAETLKIFAAKRAAFVIQAMSGAGLLSYLHVAPWPVRLWRLAAILAARKTADPLLALASLALHSEADAEILGEGLRLSKLQKRRLADMARVYAVWHGLAAPPEPGLLREALFLHGAPAARDALALVEAESSVAPDDPGFARADAFLRDTPRPKAPFAASDLLARGLAPGAELGEALKRLQALWIRAGFPQEPQIVANLIDEARASIGG
ncbi:CCA tRNA nucleotidyltransferase [uncultured Rhodoblastus sp.]|uniref:CCA tRNA nucleotidyltransferase n=1 Tax=uncultured Rhodoblastus sp. TaxID=543037 RepID=UPI0025FCCEE6|nr:CCA tRNA nucleotidyltransferase [uncultured Rhodoblastus sp.]